MMRRVVGGGRAVRGAAWGALALVGALLVGSHLYRGGAARATAGAAAASGVDTGTALGGTPAPNVTLTDQFGRRRSLAAFRGRVVVMAFIDSRCTTTCPLTAQMLRDVRTLLGPAGSRLALVAVNANPGATSVADVLQWSRQHGMTHAWEFLTGPAPALRRIWSAYGIGVEVGPGGEVTHTDAEYVIGPHGRERWLFLTDSAYSGLVPEAHALAARVAALLPGHPAVAGAAALGGGGGAPLPAGGGFALPLVAAQEHGGPAGEVSVGQGGTGAAPRLVDFFATWCQACRRDLAALGAYQRQAAGGGLPGVLAVDMRVAEPSTAWVQAFVRGLRPDFPVALDATGRVADAYGVAALPYMALVSGDGRILWRHEGALSAAAIAAAVRRALGAGPGGSAGGAPAKAGPA